MKKSENFKQKKSSLNAYRLLIFIMLFPLPGESIIKEKVFCDNLVLKKYENVIN